MINVVLAVIIFLILGVAGGYVFSQKKKGNHCMGCPCANSCKKHQCNINSHNCR